MQQKIMTLQEDFKNPNQIKAIMFDIFNGHGVKTEFHKKIFLVSTYFTRMSCFQTSVSWM